MVENLENTERLQEEMQVILTTAEITRANILVSFQPVLQNRDPTVCPVL